MSAQFENNPIIHIIFQVRKERDASLTVTLITQVRQFRRRIRTGDLLGQILKSGVMQVIMNGIHVLLSICCYNALIILIQSQNPTLLHYSFHKNGALNSHTNTLSTVAAPIHIFSLCCYDMSASHMCKYMYLYDARMNEFITMTERVLSYAFLISFAVQQ